MTKEEAQKLAAEIESLYSVRTTVPTFEYYPKKDELVNSYYVGVWLDATTLVGTINDIKQIEVWCRFAEIVQQAQSLQHMEEDHVMSDSEEFVAKTELKKLGVHLD